MKENFANSFLLTKFMLRRERFIALAWILIFTLIIVGLVPGMMPVIDAESRAEMASMLELPAMVAMIGPAIALNHDGFGAFYTNMMLLFSVLTIGIMNIFLIVRHTRADEEQGRYEVLRSLPLGRLSNITSAFILAILINVLLSVLLSVFMFIVGDYSMGLMGSLIFGFAHGATGLVFAAFTALFCQMSSNSRGAISYSFFALIIFYFMRAAGDMNTGIAFLSYISPLGLVLHSLPYAGDNVLPLLVMVLTAVVVGLIAMKISATRDIDQGIIPARAGRREASALLRTSWGLSFKLTCTAIVLVLIGIFVLGASYAAILGDVENFVASNDFYRELLLTPAGINFEVAEGMSTEEIVEVMNSVLYFAGYNITQLFASMINNIMVLVALAAPLLFVLRVKGEEKAVRAELILATSTSRFKFMGGFVTISVVVSFLIQLVLGLGLYSVARGVIPNPADLPLRFTLESALVYVPAMWLMTGIVIFLIGAFPKFTGLIWGYYGYTFLVVFIGRLAIFPSWLSYTTPIGLVPQLPMDEINYLNLIILTGIAVALTALGFFFYNRRDINAVTS